VLADGSFQFDQIIFWLDERWRKHCITTRQSYLYSDEETISDILYHHSDEEAMTPMDVAIHYTYPLKYVEEVLWEKL
jgi:hypothetical protein